MTKSSRSTPDAQMMHRVPWPRWAWDIHHWNTGIAYLWLVRSCTRSGCRETAEVALEFQYASSSIWIDDVAPEREPNVYELCGKHWARFAPPNGWSVDDRRRVDVIPFVHRLAG